VTAWAWAAIGLPGMLLAAALGDLASEEIRGWLDLAPRAILRLAAARLEDGQREAIYRDEWLPELVYALRGAESRPVTRLVRGTAFALGLLLAARRIARYRSPVPHPGLRSFLVTARYALLIVNHPLVKEHSLRQQPMSVAHAVDLMSTRLAVPAETLLADWRFVNALEAAMVGHFCHRARPGVPQDLSDITPVSIDRLEYCACRRGQLARARLRRWHRHRGWPENAGSRITPLMPPGPGEKGPGGRPAWVQRVVSFTPRQPPAG
jgi:hypothetical protein